MEQLFDGVSPGGAFGVDLVLVAIPMMILAAVVRLTRPPRV